MLHSSWFTNTLTFKYRKAIVHSHTVLTTKSNHYKQFARWKYTQIHDKAEHLNLDQVFFLSCHNMMQTEWRFVGSCVSMWGWVAVAVSAHVSVTCSPKLTSLLPWTPSAEKYKWATKREVRKRKREPDRQREGGGDELGNRGSLCMNIKVFLILPLPDMWSLLSPPANEDIWHVCECICVAKDTKGGRGEVESDM